MPAIRRSKKLTAFVAEQLYEVPTGKSASLSAALVNPRNATLFVQKAALNGALVVSAPTAYGIVLGNVYNGPIDLKIDSGGVPYKVTAANTTWPAALTTNLPMTVQYRLGATTNPESPLGTILGGAQASLVYKNLPLIDYQSDPKKNNIAFAYSADTSQGNFYIRANLIAAFTITGSRTSSPGYAGANTYWDAGGAGYDGCGISVGVSGAASLFQNSLTTAATGGVANQNYTTEMGGGAPNSIAASAAQARTIVPGSPQIFFAVDIPYFWCSSTAAAQPPMMCRFSVNQLKTGPFSTWEATTAAAFTGAANGEKLYWVRYCDADGKFYVGSSAGKIYVSGTAAFIATYAALAGIPADVDVTFPPIRFAANKLAFRSIAGGGFWELTMGAAPAWVNVVGYNNATGYVAEPALAAVIATAGLTVIAQDSIGARAVDKRLYSATQKYTVSVGFDSRDVTADLLQKVSLGVERTNIVLEAGDKIFAYSEKANTLAHVYGFED